MRTKKEIESKIEELKAGKKILESLMLKDTYKAISDLKEVKRDTQRDIDTLNWVLK